MRVASAEIHAMMTVGSVRGKHRLEMPLRVAQSARLCGVSPEVLPMLPAPTIEAMSVGGQVRL